MAHNGERIANNAAEGKKIRASQYSLDFMFTTMITSVRASIYAQGGSHMHGDAGSGREKTKARPRLLRGLPPVSTQSPILTGLDQSPVATRDHFLAFLTGSASHSKLAATRRKQRMAPSLPGSRIAHLRSGIAARFPQYSLLTSLQDQARLCYCGQSQGR